MNEFNAVSTEELSQIDGGLPLPSRAYDALRMAALVQGVTDAVRGVGEFLVNLGKGLL
jgi:hypothetical protein